MTTTDEPRPVLRDDVLYDMYDRSVCSRVGCAGYTARMTGYSIDGYRLTRITEQDVIDWWAEFAEPIRCQCGELKRAPRGATATLE